MRKHGTVTMVLGLIALPVTCSDEPILPVSVDGVAVLAVDCSANRLIAHVDPVMRLSEVRVEEGGLEIKRISAVDERGAGRIHGGIVVMSAVPVPAKEDSWCWRSSSGLLVCAGDSPDQHVADLDGHGQISPGHRYVVTLLADGRSVAFGSCDS